VLVVDTGPLVATADRGDKDHAACRALLENEEGPLVTTALVIAEAAYLIDRQLGAQAEASLYVTDGRTRRDLRQRRRPRSGGGSSTSGPVQNAWSLW